MATLDSKLLEDALQPYADKLPQLPENVVQLIVQFAPYLVLIGGILEIFNSGILNALNLGLQPAWLNNEIFTPVLYIYIIFSIIIGIILIMSFKPLLQKSMRGWRLLFNCAILSFIISIASGDIASLIIYLIGFYILFQIKSYYY